MLRRRPDYVGWMSEPEQPESYRCRLIVIVDGEKIEDAEKLEPVFAAGDIASVIITSGGLDESAFQARAEPIVAAAQAAGIAAIIDGETRVAARVGADGIQFGQDPDVIRDAIDKYSPKMMVGAANVKTRHTALVIGENQPDYVMFGKPGGDIRAEPHPKNLQLGSWWSAMIEIPCIVLGGSHIDSVSAVAASGAEFVALENAIFTADGEGELDLDGAPDRVKLANRLLDEEAPGLEIVEG